MKQGQIALVSSLLALVLIILALLFFGGLFASAEANTVREVTVDSVYVVSQTQRPSVVTLSTQQAMPSCCDVHTTINFHARELPEPRPASVYGSYYVPSCCGTRPVYTTYHDSAVIAPRKPIHGVFYTPGC